MAHIHYGIIYRYKEKIMNCTDKWVELEEIIWSEVNQTQKENFVWSFSSEVPSYKYSDMGTDPGVTAEARNVKSD